MPGAAAASYRGDGKTDAQVAAIIADQARMRRDLQPMRVADEISSELAILKSRRTELMRDRARTINRLRALLSMYFPALELAVDINNANGGLILLSGYQTPDGIRRIGRARLETWLRKRNAYNASAIVEAAFAAAQSQHTRVSGQDAGAPTVAKWAEHTALLDREMKDLDREIEDRFRRHRLFPVIESMPGFGSGLGAELLAATGGDLAVFGTADRFASVSGLAPVSRDSGRISGKLHRPRK